MNPTANQSLFPWNAREVWRGLCFFLAFSAIYCFMAFGMHDWGMGRIMPTTLLTLFSFLLMFLMALRHNNRLVPHIVLICFWSLVMVLDLCYTQARFMDLFQYVGVSFLVTAGFVLLLQLLFIAAAKKRLNREKPEPSADN